MFACKKIKERMIYVILLILALIATVFMGETGLFLGPLMILAMSLAYGIVAKLEK